jgi:hypothetical protein
VALGECAAVLLMATGSSSLLCSFEENPGILVGGTMASKLGWRKLGL